MSIIAAALCGACTTLIPVLTQRPEQSARTVGLCELSETITSARARIDDAARVYLRGDVEKARELAVGASAAVVDVLSQNWLPSKSEARINALDWVTAGRRLVDTASLLDTAAVDNRSLNEAIASLDGDLAIAKSGMERLQSGGGQCTPAGAAADPIALWV